MTLHSDQLEIVRLRPGLEGPLARFFSYVQGSEEAKWFHPHPFTAEEAKTKTSYRGNDLYCAAILGDQVLAYAMLRGWDKGFSVPSLGIIVHPEARGIGLGRLVMQYLHTEAARRGAERIRLRVYPNNHAAITLYRSMGYVFDGAIEEEQLVGIKTLERQGK